MPDSKSVGPKEENSGEVFKEGKGMSEKLHEFCADTTAEDLWDHPLTQLIATENRKHSHPKMLAETSRTSY